MDDRRDRATLLVFTLGPRRELARRRLMPRHLGEWEASIYRRCLDAALEAGLARGLEVVVSAPEPLELPAGAACRPQSGRDFGERFASAVAAAEGGPLVAVGTDVPGLTAEHLDAALARLESNPDTVVVGPSPDGGCYLVAAARPLAGLLASVRWCGGDTRASLLAALRRAGRPVELLPPLADLDRRADLERWLAGPAAARAALQGLAARLAELLAELRRPACPVALGARLSPAPARPTGRAPPRPHRRAV